MNFSSAQSSIAEVRYLLQKLAEALDPETPDSIISRSSPRIAAGKDGEISPLVSKTSRRS